MAKALTSTFCSFPDGNNHIDFRTSLTAKQCRIFCSSWKTNKLPVQHIPPRGKVPPWNDRKECFRVREYTDHYPPGSQQHQVWHYCVPGMVNDGWRRELLPRADGDSLGPHPAALGSHPTALLRKSCSDLVCIETKSHSFRCFHSVIQPQTKGHTWESVWVGWDFPSRSSGLRDWRGR